MDRSADSRPMAALPPFHTLPSWHADVSAEDTVEGPDDAPRLAVQ
ncbi:MAG TPA: hypothetical protein VJK08_00545 [Patescibacteria group bacterium]|nr:hypothetical protein [Patescibacteria group bacterium]